MTKNIETILWAVKIGEPDYAEQIITTNKERIAEATQWAIANGFDRFRVSYLDLNKAPDFTKAINLK